MLRYILGEIDEGLVCTSPRGMYITHVHENQVNVFRPTFWNI